MKRFCLLIAIISAGCTTGSNSLQAQSSNNTLPSICQNADYLGPDGITDSFIGNQKIWSEFNDYYSDENGRKLVVFLDGTGDDKEDSSNIRVLYRMAVSQACLNKPVIPYYDKGIGAKWFDSIAGGAVGEGASLNIRQAYRFLVSTYKTGDEIYIFGFSRGAFTARSLNGFLEYAGLLDRRTIKKEGADILFSWSGTSTLHITVKDIFNRYHVKHDGTDSFESRLKSDIEKYEHEKYPDLKFDKVTVKAIGVFDTVPALGIANDEEPDNHRLDLYAQKGFHALSLDEQRNKFRLLRFDEVKLQSGQELHEVWFPGVHANIGGGYAKTIGCNTDKSNSPSYYDGLEATPLNWMLEQFNQEDIFPQIGQFQECVDGIMHDEFFDNAGLYKKMGIIRRKPLIGDTLHQSVASRIELAKLFKANENRESTGQYRPANLKYPVEKYYKIEPAHGKTADQKVILLDAVKK
jgi:hypothetical protein